MHLLAKFGPLALYVCVKNRAISPWAVSKQTTNTELETDIERSCNELPWMVSVFRAMEIAYLNVGCIN